MHSLCRFIVPAAGLLLCIAGCISDQGVNSPLEKHPRLIPEAQVKPGSSSGAPAEYAGSRRCRICHAEYYSLWKEGGHQRIECEACHGPAGDHIRLEVATRSIMRLPGEAEDCLSCHGIDSASSLEGIPRVESLEAHVRYIGEKHSVKTEIGKMNGRCIFCHDPHSLE
ncbi:MAG: hypothetical protein ABIK28_20540 [Planctomycetota bacterium]